MGRIVTAVEDCSEGHRKRRRLQNVSTTPADSSALTGTVADVETRIEGPSPEGEGFKGFD
jgi:hypothetical protein